MKSKLFFVLGIAFFATGIIYFIGELCLDFIMLAAYNLFSI